MKVVIGGAGSIGMHIAEQLIKAGKNVTIIEQDEDKAQYADEHLDALVVHGEINNLDTLREQHLLREDAFICVTNSDEINMIACGLVNAEFETQTKIARIRNLDYSQVSQKKLLGISLIVNPEVEAAKAILQTISYGASADIMLFKKTDIQIRHVLITARSPFNGKSVTAMADMIKGRCLVVAIKRGEKVFIPSGSSKLREMDKLYICARSHHLDNLLAQVGKRRLLIKNVLIAGGGRIGALVAKDLVHRGYNVKIVEKDPNRSRYLADTLPKALVIQADIASEDIFKQEQLYDNDLLITATRNQEINLLSAIYAKSLGIPRAIAVISKKNYLAIATELGIDAITNPETCAADFIIRHMRGRHFTSVYSLFDGAIEVLELTISADLGILNIPFKKMSLTSKALIAVITRGDRSFIPDGEDSLQLHDSVLLVVYKSAVKYIEKLFKPK